MRYPCSRPIGVALVILAGLTAKLPGAAFPNRPLVPPPEPMVRPLIGDNYPQDSDHDGIADDLTRQRDLLEVRARGTLTATERVTLQTQLSRSVELELVFKQQVTQDQIDAFVAMGGEITYLYRSVSYGWNGRLPLNRVRDLPPAMGATLALVDAARPSQKHLDVATRTGRVRPVWAPGFAGSASGYAGSTNITIAIIDTGVDESHTDLNGRRVYWHDFTTDANANPIDIDQHGSHVAGIALGTGAAGGAGTGTLLFTQAGTLGTAVSAGSFFPAPIDLPAVSVDFNMTARWTGGGSATNFLVSHAKGASGGWGGINGASGSSPLTFDTPLTGDANAAYSPALLSRHSASVADFVITCQVTNYHGVGDGFNTLRGVAPGCNWAAAKVFKNDGTGILTDTDSAIDDLVANRVAKNIKVMNLSLGAVGSPGISVSTRQKVNTAVNNGIVVVISAGNDGLNSTSAGREIDDPGRAAMALTMAAANDVNQLTDYTSQGFTNPVSTAGQEEDFKPDVMAPGGSSYYTSILSVDSNSSDGASFADQQTNDYAGLMGTSMASPFGAGCAALVIDALLQRGTNWDYSSSQLSRFVKMVLCATASESNTGRESGANNPTLQRAAAGPNGYPVGKDQFEGYGMINPDAAVQAVNTTLSGVASQTLGPGTMDSRVWATTVALTGGQAFQPQLTVPGTGDFDLYLYSGTPSPYGTPVILASSTSAGSGINETFTYASSSNTTALLVVKRISGSGTFSLLAPVSLAGTVRYYPTNYPPSNPSVKTVGDVTMNLTGDASLNALTLSDGTFSITNVPEGGNYCGAPLKTNDSPTANGVTSFDLALIQRHILGLTPLDSPYKLLAADVNGSGSITSFDLALIQRLILGLTSTFPAGLWRFVPADYVFPNTNSPWSAPTNRCYTGLTTSATTQDFVAIKLGDVNNSWANSSSRPAVADGSAIVSAQGELSGSVPQVSFQVSRQSAPKGELVNARVTVHGFTQVTSAQCTLEWDPTVLRFSGVEGFALSSLSAGNFNTLFTQSGKLTFAWFDPDASGETLSDGTIIFTVSFVITGESGSVSPLRLVDSPTIREASVNFAPATLLVQSGQINVMAASPVKLSLVDYGNGVIQMSVPTKSGQQYILEFVDSLPGTNWMPLSAVTGDGTVKILADPAATNSQRFYRVRIP